MNLLLIKDLNLLKTSGINDVIIVEILPEIARLTLIRRKEFLTKVKNGDIHPCVHILHKAEYPIDDEFLVLGREIKELVKTHSLKDPLIIAGLSEFRHSFLSVPLDTEDIELWFLENSGKFLPEGRPKGEFTYSYEFLRKDDSYFYYNVSVVRSDYLKRLEKSLNIEGARLWGIYPFLLSLASNRFTADKTVVLLQLSQNKLSYSAINPERLYSYGELYLQAVENGELNYLALSSELNELKSLLTPILKSETNGSLSHSNPLVLLDTDESIFAKAEAVIKSVFPGAGVNDELGIKDPQIIVSLIGLNHVFNSADSGLNLLKENEAVRFSVEKQLTMRSVLGFGMVLILFLITFFSLEAYLSGKLQEIEDSQSDITSKTTQVEQFQKENRHLRANLDMISSLKSSRAKYTALLFDITKVLTGKSCLTSIDFKTSGEGSSVICEISGRAISQEDVARVVEKMERMKCFKNVSLLFSGYKESQTGYGNNDEKTNMIRFNISATYNAD